MSSTKIYLFSSGVLVSEKQYFTLGRGQGVPFNVPVPFYYLEHENGKKILFDTGNSLKVSHNPRAHWGDIIDIYYPKMQKSEYVTNQLARLGIGPEEITHIVLSHLHLDHAGGISSFPNAQIFVQKSEYDWAFSIKNTQKNAYITDDLIHNKPEQWQLIDGDFDLFGDGIICTFPTPGHTPGHQSGLIRLTGGNLLLTCDACYTTENLRDSIPPGLVWDAELSKNSLRKIKEIAESNHATIFVGHDPDAWAKVKHSPEFYS